MNGGDETPPGPTIDWSELERVWFHHTDGHASGETHFLPENPGPSRFRGRYEFKSNGQGTIRMLHRTDRHYNAPGSWSRSGNIITIEATDQQQRTSVHRIEVLELTADVLRVRIEKTRSRPVD